MSLRLILIPTIFIVLWLDNLSAQPISYLIEINEKYQLERINAVIDPYQLKMDTLWNKGDTTKPATIIVENLPVSINVGGLTIQDKYFCYDKVDFDADYICSEYKLSIELLKQIRGWISENVGDKNGRYFDNWSKRDYEFINEFIKQPNKDIINNFTKEKYTLSEIDYNIVDNGIWVIKFSLYLFDTKKIENFIGDYEHKTDSISDLWISTTLLPLMRISNFRLLLTSNKLTLSINEYLSNIKKYKSYFPIFNYSSFLYCVKKYYSHLTFEKDSSGIQVKGFPDTLILATPNLPELNYVLNLYRSTNVSLDLNYIILNKELEKINLKNAIVTPVVVIEFWGTWCKPCLENIPHVVKLAEVYQNKIQFISIAIDKRDKWLRYINSHQLFPMTPFLAEDDIRALYSPGVIIFPTYLIVNAEGKLLHEPINYIEELNSTLESLSGAASKR